MRILKHLLIFLIVLFCAIVVISLFVVPGEYSVQRTIMIDAPMEHVFSYVKYWENWKFWSPWIERDSTIVISYEGEDGKLGSELHWDGNLELSGKGKMINLGVTENSQFSELKYQRFFYEPWLYTSDGFLRLTGIDKKTNVTWVSKGHMGFLSNLYLLFNNMDLIIGTDLEKGLKSIKEDCDADMEEVGSYKINDVVFPGQTYFVIRDTISTEEISPFLSSGYQEIMVKLNQCKPDVKGEPSSIYFSYDVNSEITDVAAAISVSGKVSCDSLEKLTIKKTEAFLIEYYGDYKGLWKPYMAMEQFLTANNINENMTIIEQYVIDSSTETDSDKWLTRIYYLRNQE